MAMKSKRGHGYMDPDKVIEKAKNWATSRKKTIKKQNLERMKGVFDRFYRGNKGYMDKEAYDKARDSAKSMAQLMIGTIEFLAGEIFRLEKKRRKLAVENLQLKDAQKTYETNLWLMREFLREAGVP
jgi:hypothetical protein